MELIIRNTTNRPIYDQIASQLKAGILSGELKPGEALPSIRALAKDLKISVVTTKRAYDELEAAGFLYTVAGKGCFVADKNPERVREGIARDMETHLSAAVRLAKESGMTYADFRETLRILWEEE
ncbi:MAG: GntR family transcriptional regulator [Oscillospiraceae bacterium]|nr:GntR family transcriptional regulator [Oscillospiraceae bacterium]